MSRRAKFVLVIFAVAILAVSVVSYFIGEKTLGVGLFDDRSVSTTVINIRRLPEIRSRLRPGNPVQVSFKSLEKSRFILKEVKSDSLLGVNNEIAYYKDMEYIEFITEADISTSSRIQQGFVKLFAAVAATIMWAASLFG